jgi:hypothetical protein
MTTPKPATSHSAVITNSFRDIDHQFRPDSANRSRPHRFLRARWRGADSLLSQSFPLKDCAAARAYGPPPRSGSNLRNKTPTGRVIVMQARPPLARLPLKGPFAPVQAAKGLFRADTIS